jgi:predicted nucleotidyltransferase
MTVDELEKAISSFTPGQQMEIKLADVTITEIYPDWFVKEAERLARKLVEAFEVDAVYLFGSSAWGERFNPNTDIDLAVSGLAPDKYFKAIGYLERETEFPFDLVDLEIAPDSLRERILQKGKLLIERKRVAEIVG